MFVKFGENFVIIDSIETISKTRYLDSSKRKEIAMNRKKTFLVFVKFGETLCSKRFDTNDLKNKLFELLEA